MAVKERTVSVFEVGATELVAEPAWKPAVTVPGERAVAFFVDVEALGIRVEAVILRVNAGTGGIVPSEATFVCVEVVSTAGISDFEVVSDKEEVGELSAVKGKAPVPTAWPAGLIVAVELL